MHSKSDKIEVLIRNETNESIKELLKCLLQRYQKGLEEKMRGSEFEFVFDNFIHCFISFIR